jgi:hypothetical protein
MPTIAIINCWPNRVIENMNIGNQNSNNVNLVESNGEHTTGRIA